jgi:hypothetical protein
MGEYAHDMMRQEIKGRHGFDIGEYDDEPRERFVKPVFKRIKCPHCECRPKEVGITQHIKDKHGIELAIEYKLREAK